MVAEVTVEQPFISVIVTLYVPAIRLFKFCVSAPPVQLYVYGAVPPLTVSVTEPLLPPLQLTFVVAVVALSDAIGWVIVAALIVEHPFISVIVTLYVPAIKLFIFCVVEPPVQLYAYGVVPPLTVSVTAPLLPPLQLTLVVAVVALSADTG